jgi:hypothetical protein
MAIWYSLRLRKLARERAQVAVLQMLLRKLVVEAFVRQNEPIWAAWSGTMGELRVSIEANARPLE